MLRGATINRSPVTALAAAAMATLLIVALAVSPAFAGRGGSIFDEGGPAYTTSALKLRSAPRLNAPVKTVLPKDTRVVITGRVVNGFYPVRYPAKRLTGYAHADSLARWATVLEAVNLRGGPGVRHEIRAVIPGGTKVVVVARARYNFYPVTYPLPEGGYLQGWVHSDYLEWSDGPVPFGAESGVR